MNHQPTLISPSTARALRMGVFVGLLALIGPGCGGCGEGSIDTAEAGTMTIPKSINFQETAIGEVDVQSFTISNSASSGVLKITAIQVVENDELIEFKQGTDWQGKIELEAGESVTMSLEWHPTDNRPDVGEVRIVSNDPTYANADSTATIDVTTPTLAPRIFSPRVISLPRVRAGGTALAQTYISNIGTSPLQVQDIFLNPQSTTEFAFKMIDTNDPLNAEADKVYNGEPIILQPQEQVPMRVYFQPTTDAPRSAEMIISSTDPSNSSYTVTLNGNSDTECIQISLPSNEDAASDATHVLNFEEAQINRTAERTVQIQNCSTTKDLKVSEITMVDSSGSVFAVVTDALPDGVGTDDGHIIAPRDSSTFVVAFSPTDDTLKEGRLEIKSNDPANATLKVDVQGRGTDNVCPTAVAQGRIESPNATPFTQTQTAPLRKILLDGSGSQDPDGTIDRYEWTIVRRPVNSTARLNPSNRVVNPELFLDLAGDYELELRTFDAQGAPSCDTAKIVIRAIPDEQILVQLTWDTPADPDQTDQFGTDLDLHYLDRQNATKWNDAPYDVFWRNLEPDWGTPNDRSDDPSLDIDDTDGSGPETVNHNPPSRPGYGPFHVGVYYYNSNGYGESYATIRIYIKGLLKYELRDKYLEKEDIFWLVGSIQWPSGLISPNAEPVSLGFPAVSN